MVTKKNKSGICTIDGCEKINFSSLYCRSHHYRYKKYGDPLHVREPKGLLAERFIKDVVEGCKRKPIDECIVCSFVVGAHGYGEFRSPSLGRKVFAHRYALQIYSGEDGEGMLACHKPLICNDRGCVNPSHLYWGTHKQNSLDMIIDGNSKKGEDSVKSKLRNEDVLSIFFDLRTASEIAKEFNISESLVWGVKSKSTWSHITKGLARPKTGRELKILTKDEVIGIYLDKRSQRKISKLYQVSRYTVSRIKKGLMYTDITKEYIKSMEV